MPNSPNNDNSLITPNNALKRAQQTDSALFPKRIRGGFSTEHEMSITVGKKPIPLPSSPSELTFTQARQCLVHIGKALQSEFITKEQGTIILQCILKLTPHYINRKSNNHRFIFETVSGAGSPWPSDTVIQILKKAKNGQIDLLEYLKVLNTVPLNITKADLENGIRELDQARKLNSKAQGKDYFEQIDIFKKLLSSPPGTTLGNIIQSYAKEESMYIGKKPIPLPSSPSKLTFTEARQWLVQIGKALQSESITKEQGTIILQCMLKLQPYYINRNSNKYLFIFEAVSGAGSPWPNDTVIQILKKAKSCQFDLLEYLKVLNTVPLNITKADLENGMKELNIKADWLSLQQIDIFEELLSSPLGTTLGNIIQSYTLNAKEAYINAEKSLSILQSILKLKPYCLNHSLKWRSILEGVREAGGAWPNNIVIKILNKANEPNFCQSDLLKYLKILNTVPLNITKADLENGIRELDQARKLNSKAQGKAYFEQIEIFEKLLSSPSGTTLSDIINSYPSAEDSIQVGNTPISLHSSLSTLSQGGAKKAWRHIGRALLKGESITPDQGTIILQCILKISHSYLKSNSFTSYILETVNEAGSAWPNDIIIQILNKANFYRSDLLEYLKILNTVPLNITKADLENGIRQLDQARKSNSNSKGQGKAYFEQIDIFKALLASPPGTTLSDIINRYPSTDKGESILAKTKDTSLITSSTPCVDPSFISSKAVSIPTNNLYSINTSSQNIGSNPQPILDNNFEVFNSNQFIQMNPYSHITNSEAAPSSSIATASSKPKNSNLKSVTHGAEALLASNLNSSLLDSEINDPLLASLDPAPTILSQELQDYINPLAAVYGLEPNPYASTELLYPKNTSTGSLKRLTPSTDQVNLNKNPGLCTPTYRLEDTEIYEDYLSNQSVPSVNKRVKLSEPNQLKSVIIYEDEALLESNLSSPTNHFIQFNSSLLDSEINDQSSLDQAPPSLSQESDRIKAFSELYDSFDTNPFSLTEKLCQKNTSAQSSSSSKSLTPSTDQVNLNKNPGLCTPTYRLEDTEIYEDSFSNQPLASRYSNYFFTLPDENSNNSFTAPPSLITTITGVNNKPTEQRER